MGRQLEKRDLGGGGGGGLEVGRGRPKRRARLKGSRGVWQDSWRMGDTGIGEKGSLEAGS